jgi:hypothetical protein
LFSELRKRAGLKNSVLNLVKKVQVKIVVRRARNRSFGFAQDRLSAGILEQYGGARQSSATKQVGLFQQADKI